MRQENRRQLDNFSTAVQARYPERLAVQQVLWSDWGRGVRIIDTMTHRGVSVPSRTATDSSSNVPAVAAILRVRHDKQGGPHGRIWTASVGGRGR